MTDPANETPDENPNADETRSGGMAEQEHHEDTIDFFGATASPTLPVPSTPPAPGDGPAPAVAAIPAAVPRVSRGIRVRTLVFGLVLLTISILSGIALLTAVQLDGGVIGLGLMVGAGAGLLIGGLAAAVRDVRQGGARFS